MIKEAEVKDKEMKIKRPQRKQRKTKFEKKERTKYIYIQKYQEGEK